MAEPVSIDLTLRPPTDIPGLLGARRQAESDAAWYSTVEAPDGPAPGGTYGPRLTPNTASTSEHVRAKGDAEQAMDEQTPMAAEGVARLLGFKDMKAARRTLVKGLGLGDVLKMTDVPGNVVESALRDQAKGFGFPDDLVEQIAAAGGLASVLFPAPGSKIEKSIKAFRAGAAKAEQGLQKLEGLAADAKATSERIAPDLRARVVKALREQRGSMVPDAGAAAGDGTGSGEKATLGASHINTRRVDAAESVKATMRNLSRIINAEGTDVTKARTPVTHEQTIEASRGALSLDEALATPDEVWLLEEMKAKQQALRDIHATVSTEVDRLMHAANKGDQASADELLNVYPIAIKVAGSNELVGMGAGRILEARKIDASAARAAGMSMADLIAAREKLGAEFNGDGFQLAKQLAQLPREARQSLMKKLWGYYKVGNDIFHWAFLQSLLSGPVTHAANILGTAAVQVYHFPERYVAEWIHADAAGAYGAYNGVQRGETWAMARNAGEALTDAWRAMGKAWKTGEAPFAGGSRIETRFDLTAKQLERPIAAVSRFTAKQFGWDPTTPLGKAVDIAGMLMPTRGMMAEDAFYKVATKTMEIKALALRQAMLEGRKGADLATRIGFLERNPLPGMIRDAEGAANMRTLNAALGNLGGSQMMALRNAVPMGAYIMPFLQTPINSYKWFHQRAPILSLLSIQNVQDLAAGGAAADMAAARILLGHAVGGVVAYNVLQGNIVGGMLPGSNRSLGRDLKASGVQPYTIRVGDEFFGYKRTDPVGQYIGAIATALEIYSQLSMHDPDAPDYADFVWAAALAGSRVALDTPFLQGLDNVLGAIHEPDLRGKKAALRFVQAAIPAGAQMINRAGIPGVLEARPELRDFENWVDALKAVTPGYSKEVPPVLHPITGEAVVRPPGWGPDQLSPVFVSRLVDDPTLMAIITNGMSFAEPSRLIFGTGDPGRINLDPTRVPDAIRLTTHQFYQLKVLATQTLRDGSGRTMHEAMNALVLSWRTMTTPPSAGPDGGRETRLKLIYRDFYNKARATLERDDKDLAARMRAGQRARQERMKSAPTAPGTTTIGPGLTIGR